MEHEQLLKTFYEIYVKLKDIQTPKRLQEQTLIEYNLNAFSSLIFKVDAHYFNNYLSLYIPYFSQNTLITRKVLLIIVIHILLYITL